MTEHLVIAKIMRTKLTNFFGADIKHPLAGSPAKIHQEVTGMPTIMYPGLGSLLLRETPLSDEEAVRMLSSLCGVICVQLNTLTLQKLGDIPCVTSYSGLDTLAKGCQHLAEIHSDFTQPFDIPGMFLTNDCGSESTIVYGITRHGEWLLAEIQLKVKSVDEPHEVIGLSIKRSNATEILLRTGGNLLEIVQRFHTMIGEFRSRREKLLKDVQRLESAFERVLWALESLQR